MNFTLVQRVAALGDERLRRGQHHEAAVELREPAHVRVHLRRDGLGLATDGAAGSLGRTTVLFAR